MKKTIIELKELTKYYGKTRGIENISLRLSQGEIFGLIGENGAGKSTTIRTIMHLLNKTSGQVLINNKEFVKTDISIKESIGYLPSEICLYCDLTVKQMLNYHASFFKKSTNTRRRKLVKLLKLDETKKIEDLSLGNLKKLGIVLAFMHQPQILILDEPTSGLDPIMQNVFYELIKEEKQKGTTILYSTHILNEVSKICDRVGIIKDGRLIKVETVEDLTKQNLGIVTITSVEIERIIKELKVEVIYKNETTVKFKNNLSHQDLLEKLTTYKIDKILIEDMNLEDMFLHYARRDDNV
ncbi:MAG: ABC transporter ATP-binding protein [bacterium]|nr:ABC transporter ATP-binding protein [bacterium]